MILMAMKFRRLSIRSRKRTLALAGLALVVEMVVSHPRFDMAAGMAHVARIAAPALMAASPTDLTRPGTASEEGAPALVPTMDYSAGVCAKSRRVDS
jgi:hypothetical protein